MGQKETTGLNGMKTNELMGDRGAWGPLPPLLIDSTSLKAHRMFLASTFTPKSLSDCAVHGGKGLEGSRFAVLDVQGTLIACSNFQLLCVCSVRMTGFSYWIFCSPDAWVMHMPARTASSAHLPGDRKIQKASDAISQVCRPSSPGPGRALAGSSQPYQTFSQFWVF